MSIEHPDKIGIGTGEWTSVPGVALDDVDRAGFTWYYDWSADDLSNPTTTPHNASYIPMIWSEGDVTDRNLTLAQTSGAAALLGFNEPDNPDQAAMTVERALELWPQLQATGMRLGSPAATQGEVLGDTSWLGRFMSGAADRGLQVDFIAVHYYSTSADVAEFERWLDAVQDQYGKPIWVTEWALADWTDPSRFSAAEQAQFARAGSEMMDKLPFVERQAWFAAYEGGDGWNLHSGVFDANDTLTPVGGAFGDMLGPRAALPPSYATSGLFMAPVSIGFGPDILALEVSADAWRRGLRFTIGVDGEPVGDIQSATASHAAGAAQPYWVRGDFGPGPHTVEIALLDDASGPLASSLAQASDPPPVLNVVGRSATQRPPGPPHGPPPPDPALYVSGVSFDGQASAQSLVLSGPQTQPLTVTVF